MKEQKQSNELKMVFSTNDSGTTRNARVKLSYRQTIHPFIKIHSKFIIDLNKKYKVIKLLDYHIERKLADLVYGNNFAHMIPQIQSTKTNN